jgi:hypothetical protein
MDEIEHTAAREIFGGLPPNDVAWIRGIKRFELAYHLLSVGFDYLAASYAIDEAWRNGNGGTGDYLTVPEELFEHIRPAVRIHCVTWYPERFTLELRA